MKKLLFILGLSVACVSSEAALISTNLGLLSGAGPAAILTTNRASVYSVEVTANNAVSLDFYDSDNNAAPYYGTNYTNTAYTSRITFNTNYVTTFIGNNGYTNWYTNAGLTTINITNAAGTNVLPKMASFVIAPNTYAVYTLDAMFSRGIAVLQTSGSNASVVINYRTSGN